MQGLAFEHVTDPSSPLPPDLPRLRVLAVYLETQLGAVREAIAAAERRAAEDAGRARWWVQWARRREGEPKHGLLHEEGCWRSGEPNLTAAQVRAVLAAHGERILRCEVCTPGRRPPPVRPLGRQAPHSAWSTRSLAACSCRSMVSGELPRAVDMETVTARLPSSVAPFRVM